MRGDVVVLDFPFAEGGVSKVRPALVVQADAITSIHTVVAQITSAKQRHLPSRLLVDPADEPGSGLRIASLVVCEQLYTIHRDRILKTIGAL
jgi:mRNA-degrading endonuclease toxin of MazEF toxin-antitoxin module